MAQHYILTHGLNVQPAAMQRWAERLPLPLNRCTFICLPGHAPGDSLRNITANRWLDSFSDQYQAAAAAHAHSDIVYLGYSLGGLLMTYLLGKRSGSASGKASAIGTGVSL